jgi:hypothetical protein
LSATLQALVNWVCKLYAREFYSLWHCALYSQSGSMLNLPKGSRGLMVRVHCRCAVPRLRRLVSRLSLEWPRIRGGQSGTGTGFFSEYFCFPLSVSFHQRSILIHLFLRLYNLGICLNRKTTQIQIYNCLVWLYWSLYRNG